MLEPLALILLLAAQSIAAWKDIRSRRIPNLLTYSLLLIGWAFGAVNSLLLRNTSSTRELIPWQDVLGQSFPNALGGSVACFSIMFIIYSYTNSGAGDVKLAAGIGAFLGTQGGLLTICYAYITAACFASCLMIWTFGFGYVARSCLRVLGVWPYPEDPAIEGQAKSIMSKGLPLAPFFLIGTILTIFDLPSFRYHT